MERRKLLDSLRTSVKRLNELSPKLNRPESSVLKGQGVPINQWQDELEIFIKAIDGTIERKPQSDCDVWVADVKVLAVDVEEILNEIARTKTFEEPSKDRFRFLKEIRGKAVLTVNDDLKTKIDRASRKMDTLKDRRRKIGLQVGPSIAYPAPEQPPPAQ